MKDFTNKDCCLNCYNFEWWDGDYCCVPHLKIHQYGFDIHHYPYMNEDIDNTMQTPETCEDYLTLNNDWSDWIIEEYKKYKELQKLCKNLENFVK